MIARTRGAWFILAAAVFLASVFADTAGLPQVRNLFWVLAGVLAAPAAAHALLRDLPASLGSTPTQRPPEDQPRPPAPALPR